VGGEEGLPRNCIMRRFKICAPENKWGNQKKKNITKLTGHVTFNGADEKFIHTSTKILNKSSYSFRRFF